MKISGSSEKNEIIVFTAIVIVLSSLICLLAYTLGNPNISILCVFTPSLLALIFTAITGGKKGINELFIKQTIRKTAIKWILLSLVGIPALASLAMLTSLGFDVSGFHLRTTQLLPQMVVIVLIALGEEYGWRGFLLPRLLNRFNLLYASLILGLIWGCWHFPAYLIGTGVPMQMDFTVFLLWIVLGTFFISWIYYRTRSVLTSILAHISANAAFNYLLVLPEFTGNMNTFWIFIACIAILMILIFMVRREDFIKRLNNE